MSFTMAVIRSFIARFQLFSKAGFAVIAIPLASANTGRRAVCSSARATGAIAAAKLASVAADHGISA
jgi:hypothetical protein